MYYKEDTGDVSQDILYHLHDVMSDKTSTEKKGNYLRAIAEIYFPLL